MTMKERQNSCSSASSRRTNTSEQRRNIKSAIALRRYLDLTLKGTRKDLADHGHKAKQGHPISPYTFDCPDVEKSIQRVLMTPEPSEHATRPPTWFNEINNRVVKHTGEAPIFTEHFLPSRKEEQAYASHGPHSRPLSGISTKSAPVIINGEMYYRQNKTHTFLQASHRPASAKEDRLTRATKLRNKHKSRSMSGVPSDGTRDELQRIRDSKPKKQNLNKDLLPIPCHTNETPHSFIVGARYNCSHFMDSRSFSRLGLYMPRRNPLGAFLKTYKEDSSLLDNCSESEAIAGHTSVRTGGSSGKHQSSNTQPFGIHNARVHPPRSKESSFPRPHVRKVVKEAWLSSGEGNRKVTKSNSRNAAENRRGSFRASVVRSPVPPHPSPKLIVPRPASSNRESTSGKSKDNQRDEHAKSSLATHVQEYHFEAGIRPATTLNYSRNSKMLSDLHLPKQTSLQGTKSSRSSSRSSKKKRKQAELE